ncbi:hypothetical protein BC332_06239 [Capsicum chinense]|nr:hypothetical protein BC332_06239 [Capsicum chinense]
MIKIPTKIVNKSSKTHWGPAVPVDSALQQPLGMPAMTAAAVMARAPGAAQSGSSLGQSGVDPLTLYMSTTT